MADLRDCGVNCTLGLTDSWITFLRVSVSLSLDTVIGKNLLPIYQTYPKANADTTSARCVVYLSGEVTNAKKKPYKATSTMQASFPLEGDFRKGVKRMVSEGYYESSKIPTN